MVSNRGRGPCRKRSRQWLLLITLAETWCGHERQRVLHPRVNPSQEQLHVVDERVLSCVLNTKTRHGCTALLEQARRASSVPPPLKRQLPDSRQTENYVVVNSLRGCDRYRLFSSMEYDVDVGPDWTDHSLGTSTILPVTPPSPSNSCASLASTSRNRCAISGLIFFC